jgi:hypothetical protein
LEIALPVAFAALLLWIKQVADDSSDFKPQVVAPQIRSDYDTQRILSFGDYVTAIVAKRICRGSDFNWGGGDNFFTITGLPTEGYNWQVPVCQM